MYERSLIMLPTPIRNRTRALFDNPFGALESELARVANYWSGDEQTGTAFYPVDVREDDGHIYVDAELPGFTKEDIDITLSNGVLTIQAERKETEDKPGERHLTERRFRRVSRSFTMPKTVDTDKVEATLRDGVLHLVLSKREDVKPRKIEVRSTE